MQNITSYSERRESAWREIYESRQTRMLLAGEVSAVENHGSISCAVVNYFGIKVIIPANYLSTGETDTGRIHAMMGARIEFVVIALDRENGLATGSRKLAMEIRQKDLPNLKPGDRVRGRVIAVGVSKAIIEVCGLDVAVRNTDISWGYIFDVRAHLFVGDELEVLVKAVEESAGTLAVSVKEALPDPFLDAAGRYIANNKYKAVVTGIQDYGIFCNLEPGLDVLCPHPGWVNIKLCIGDVVVVKVKEINAGQRRIRGLVDRLIRRG